MTVNRFGEVIEANLAAVSLLGGKRSTLLGQSLSGFTLAEYAEEPQRFLAELHESGEPNACEVHRGRSSERSFPVCLHGVALGRSDEHREPRASIAIGDLSEITRAQRELARQGKALRRNEDRLASFMDDTSDCILILSEDGTITDVNPPTLALLGVSKEAGIGMHIALLEDDISSTLSAPVKASEVLWSDHEDEVHIMRLSSSRIRSATNTVKHLCTAQDVTGQKDTQEKLRLNEQLLRQSAEGIEDGFYLREYVSGAFSYVSPTYESIFGHSCQKFYDQPNLMLSLVHDEDAEALPALRSAFVRGDPCDEEYRIVQPNGDVRWIRERAFLVEGGDGEIERTAGIAQDVTDQRLMDIEIRQGQKMEAIYLRSFGTTNARFVVKGISFHVA